MEDSKQGRMFTSKNEVLKYLKDDTVFQCYMDLECCLISAIEVLWVFYIHIVNAILAGHKWWNHPVVGWLVCVCVTLSV